MVVTWIGGCQSFTNLSRKERPTFTDSFKFTIENSPIKHAYLCCSPKPCCREVFYVCVCVYTACSTQTRISWKLSPICLCVGSSLAEHVYVWVLFIFCSMLIETTFSHSCLPARCRAGSNESQQALVQPRISPTDCGGDLSAWALTSSPLAVY